MNFFIIYYGKYKYNGEAESVINNLNNYVYSLVEDVSPQYVICTSNQEHLVISQEELEVMQSEK